MKNQENPKKSGSLFLFLFLKAFLSILTDNCIMDMIQLRSVLFE